MKKYALIAVIIVSFAGTLALNLMTGSPNAAVTDMSGTVTVGNISVSNAWSRASAGLTRAGAAFLSVTNAGSEDDRLVDAATPAAHRAELHNHLMESGVMKMRRVTAIDIPAGQTVMLKPGGLHVMMFKLLQVFEEGAHYPLTLTFEKAGDVTLMVHIGKAGAKGVRSHEMHKKNVEN